MSEHLLELLLVHPSAGKRVVLALVPQQRHLELGQLPPPPGHRAPPLVPVGGPPSAAALPAVLRVLLLPIVRGNLLNKSKPLRGLGLAFVFVFLVVALYVTLGRRHQVKTLPLAELDRVLQFKWISGGLREREK